MKKLGKATKSYTIISENPKMDTTGMAGKPKEYAPIEWKPPAMSLADMMEVREHKQAKKPEMDD